VLIAGHYPLLAHAVIACQQFTALRILMPPRASGIMVPWACVEPSLRHQLDGVAAGDHGAGWETANLLALHPETVNLTTLPPPGEPLIGIGGPLDPRQATADQGDAQLAAYSDLLLREAHHRLAHPTWYANAAYLFQHGLWRKDD